MRQSSLKVHAGSTRSRLIAEHAALAHERRENLQARLLREAMPLAHAAQLTGSSEGHLRRLVASGDAIAVAVEGRLLLPTWQLRANAVAPVVPGVRRLVRAFPGDIMMLHCWVTRASADLGGDAPATALQRGQVDVVASLAASIGAAGR